MSAKLRLSNLNQSHLRTLQLDKDLVRLMLTVEERPCSKAELLRKGFSAHQVSTLLKRLFGRKNRIGRIQLGTVGEVMLHVAFSR